MKYFFVTFLISTFVIVYVWQNIEMMKIKMTYNRLLSVKSELVEEKNRLLYEFEKSRNFENMKKTADESGYRQIEPGDVYFFKEKTVFKGKEAVK